MPSDESSPVHRKLFGWSSVVIHPVMPQKTQQLWQRLGWVPDEELADGLKWGGLRPGSKVTPGPALFPRKP